MASTDLITLSLDLDNVGLVWAPEIGDEIVARESLEKVSILVDPLGLTPNQLRTMYVWLPNVEQIVRQFEARQAMIFHAGVTETFSYEAVIKSSLGLIEAQATTLRLAFGTALKKLLSSSEDKSFH